MREIAVIGAGITGITTAHALMDQGFEFRIGTVNHVGGGFKALNLKSGRMQRFQQAPRTAANFQRGPRMFSKKVPHQWDFRARAVHVLQGIVEFGFE